MADTTTNTQQTSLNIGSNTTPTSRPAASNTPTQKSTQTPIQTHEQKPQTPTHTPEPTTQTQAPVESESKTQEPQNLEVTQEQVVTTNQQKKYLNLEEKSRYTTLTADEKDELNKQKEKQGNVDNKQNLREEKGKEEEEFKPFKEEDILQYMYQQWLLGGMNWICNWTYNKVEDWGSRFSKGLAEGVSDTWHNVKDGFKEGLAEGRNNPQQTAGNGAAPTVASSAAAKTSATAQDTAAPAEATQGDTYNAMEKCLNTNNEIRQKFDESDIKPLQKSFQKEQEFITRLKEGKTTEEDRKRPQYQTFAKLPPEKRNQQIETFAKDTEKNYANVSQTMEVAEHLVHLKHTNRALGQDNPKPMNRVAYKREVALMAMVIGHQLSQSKKPEEFLENISETLKRGQDHTFNEVKQGNYAVNGKTPTKNPHLNNMYKQLGLNENGEYSPTKTLEIINKKPENNFEKMLHQVSCVYDTKSELTNMAQRSNSNAAPEHQSLPSLSEKPTTMDKALTNYQGREEAYQGTLSNFNAADSNVAGAIAANKERRSHAADRIAAMKSYNQARGAEYTVQKDKSISNNAPKTPVFKLPPNFKGPDRR